jgi:hypothetical protein
MHNFEVPQEYLGGPAGLPAPAGAEVAPETTGVSQEDVRDRVFSALAPLAAEVSDAWRTGYPVEWAPETGGEGRPQDSLVSRRLPENGWHKPAWLTWPRAFGAVVLAVGIPFAAVEVTSGSGGVSIEQAANPSTLGYANMPNITAARETVIKQRLNEAHELLVAYKPFIIEAANDPRVGDPNTVPDHMDETIVQIALLFSGNWNNPLGPVPVPAKAQKQLIEQMNATNKDKKLGLPLISENPQEPETVISTNMRVALLQVRSLYTQWAGEKDKKGKLVNVGKPVTDFALYYFGTDGNLAEQIEESWGNPSNVPVQELLSSDKFANNGLAPAIGALVSAGLLQVSNTGSNG